ncbi:hypothetical protein Mth01_37780 [Sphaerimonospora thailandensis]|uniref:Uncharacterized protein n=1 Tax=Sphaerimonospora thailandensis TaxID=795644 RepID=A0A8J3W0T7_9ACTN|nr:hypothetical protein Mth01_37780 [Sphaerimonospora thailandensis]
MVAEEPVPDLADGQLPGPEPDAEHEDGEKHEHRDHQTGRAHRVPRSRRLCHRYGLRRRHSPRDLGGLGYDHVGDSRRAGGLCVGLVGQLRLGYPKNVIVIR